ncbi:MAG: hypothetical protein AAFX79_13520 [Planctomycetota bacterium]
MVCKRSTAVVTVALAFAGSSAGQVEMVARTHDPNAEFGEKATDAAISVGSDAIVVTSNHGITMLSKTGVILDDRPVGVGGVTPWPFIRVGTGSATPAESRFFDGRTDYGEGRQWISYSEENRSGTGANNISPLHLAVNKNPALFPAGGTLNTFNDSHWWYFTGTDTDPGNGGSAFRMWDTTMDRYDDGGTHNPFPLPIDQAGLFDLPVISIDEQAIYVTAFGFDVPPGAGAEFSCLFIIPLRFNPDASGVPQSSILDGDRPDEDDFLCMRFEDLEDTPFVSAPDSHTRQYPVQEPHEQYENTQLFVGVGESGEQTAIRMGGMWFDENANPAPRWRYTQRLDVSGSSPTGDLEDMEINTSGGFNFFYSGVPATAPGFSPNVPGSFISSAVLTEDNQGNPRVFVAHHCNPSDEASTPQRLDEWVVQWYVIDPDLGNFQTSPSVWQPSIIERGRLSGTGDYYHPTIGVTRQGTAYLEYTYSDNIVGPEVRRARLNSSYDAIVSGSEVVVEAGPGIPYILTDGKWADFSDMQHDPVSCKLWSVHTLVHEPGNQDTFTDKRDIWLFELPYNCFSPDLNQNMVMDPGDVALFDIYYADQDERADADFSGEIDAYDAAAFIDAYTAGTP